MPNARSVDCRGDGRYDCAAASRRPLTDLPVLHTRVWDDQSEPFARDHRVVRYDVLGLLGGIRAAKAAAPRVK